ncbi:TraR/DksA family transcriptional regulator [Polluticaenibacter yanchengensis]|uniref:TraR/DksA C4-type zinc finger protein n=1 Tax=Polluticaenibacter yanchengensis TaxID=3014562 RepID=A0ABT4UI91_9BACT|nr:TraR/DksA C4-type zinc finger protein [Chitinophagaceae bacterium LY-5]
MAKKLPTTATNKKAEAKKAKPAPAKAVKAAVKKTSKEAPKALVKAKAAPAKKDVKASVKKAAVATAAVKPSSKAKVSEVKKATKPIKKSTVASKTAPTKAVTKPAVVKKEPVKAPAKKAEAINIKKKPVSEVKKQKETTPAKETKVKAKETVSVEKPSKVKSAAKNDVEVESSKAPAKKAAAKKEEPLKPVKLPKITSTGKVNYTPDFTTSVLDIPAKEEKISSAPALRYSDSDLAEFKNLILKKLEAAKKEMNYLQGLITRKDAMGGDNDDGRYMTMEDGSLSMEREQLSQLASRQITFIDHLEKALIRIENKTYGVCRVTGKLIDKARLRAVPHATLSMEAKEKQTR